MSTWHTSPLGEVVTIVGGGTPTRSNPDFYDGTIPWVTPKDMKSWEITGAQITITQSGLDNSATRLVPRDSILIVVRSGVLKHTIPVGLNRLPVAINQDMKALQCRDGIDADFLARFIKAQSPIILQWVRATTADNFPIDKLKKLPVPLPPLAEQRRIAEVLDRAEALRAKRRAALAQLDSLTQSLFLDLFGPNGKHRSSCSTAYLGSLCRSINDGVHKTPTYIESGVPFVTVKNIVNGTLDLTGTKFISEDDHRAFTRRTKPERGDVLVSKDGTIGVPCPITTDEEFSIFVSVALIKPKQELIDQSFLVAQFQSDWVQRQIRAGSKGIAIRHLHLEDFKRLVFLVPPLPLQREFAGRAQAVEKLKAAQRASLAELDALFASLQHRAFRGEL